MMMDKVAGRRLLARVFPISTWATSYDLSTAISDLVAGITVALTLIPQSIAYASLAGLDPQYGLYSSFAGSLVYMLLGTTPEVNIGPTALLSLLTFTYTGLTNADFAVLLCFLGGFVQLAVGFSRLGFLVEFVSLPVVSGFTSAAALIIACSQMKGLLGLSFKAESFLEIWHAIITNIKYTRVGDAVLSAVCCVVLVAMRQLKDLKFKPRKSDVPEKSENKLQKAIWFISVGRNAIVVVFCAVIAYIVDLYDPDALILTGNIESGLPSFGLPNFNTTVGNQTYTFQQMSQHLGSGLLVVPLIGIIANVAIAKAFAKGKILDANQEIIALGFCNVISGLVQSIPVNGSFSRSAVSNASGVKTPGVGLYTGIIVLMTLGFLTPYFYFIPKAALSSVIICAVLYMIDLKIIKNLWDTSRADLLPLFGTFITSLLFGVEIGILTGVGIDILILLYFNARPRLSIEVFELEDNCYYTLATPSGGLFFASTTYVREKLGKYGSEQHTLEYPSRCKPTVVINCVNLQRADWTSLQGLKSLVSDFKKEDKFIIFMNCRSSILNKFSNEMGNNFTHCSSERDLQDILKVHLSGRTTINGNDIKLTILEPQSVNEESR